MFNRFFSYAKSVRRSIMRQSVITDNQLNDMPVEIIQRIVADLDPKDIAHLAQVNNKIKNAVYGMPVIANEQRMTYGELTKKLNPMKFKPIKEALQKAQKDLAQEEEKARDGSCTAGDSLVGVASCASGIGASVTVGRAVEAAELCGGCVGAEFLSCSLAAAAGMISCFTCCFFGVSAISKYNEKHKLQLEKKQKKLQGTIDETTALLTYKAIN